MSEAAIAIAASGRTWALGLHRFVADHGGARVRVRVMHPEQALEEAYDVLVIDDVTSFLSAHLVRQVQRRDRKVLGVFEEAAGETRLSKLGVNAVISADAPPESFVASIVTLAAQHTVDEEFAELIADLHGDTVTHDDEPAAPGGRVFAVAGAGGGVGATEVSVTLAAELSRRGLSVCAVDADDVASVLAQRLDLPLHPNVRTAMDHVQHHSGSVIGTVHSHAGGFSVLPGLPNPRDWEDVRAGDTVDVISELTESFDVVVVNISQMVEQRADNPRGEGRFGVARLVLGAADAVVLVAVPTPMGVARVIDWLADTRSILGDRPLHVILNRFEDGLFARAEVEREIGDVVAPASITVAPHDRTVVTAAWEGTVPPAGKFVAAIGHTADRLTSARAPGPRRLRLRR